MYLNFIGAPCSGKTTSAAKLFAELKEMGLEVEFISEYARLYIAKKRIINDLKPINLDSSDQYQIFCGQLDLETTMSKSGGTSSIIISDSSVWNSCLYMEPEYREKFKESLEYKQSVSRFTTEKNLNVILSPEERPFTPDSNLVHSKEESLKIHDNIRCVLDDLLPGNKFPMLFGSVEERHKALVKLVFEKYY